MKSAQRLHLVLLTLMSWTTMVQGQISPHVANIFPPGTIVHPNIPYAGDTDRQHLLDIYLPENKSGPVPVVIWVHGGAWMTNDKYADMSYMKNTIRDILSAGFGLASIDYRYSTRAVFPAQIQDVNQAVQWLWDHAAEHGLDRSRMVLMGFSAGGHLVNLLGVSNNNHIRAFYPPAVKPDFRIRGVVDFYGPSDLLMLANSPDTAINNERNPVSILLGAMPVNRPDLARTASAVNYIDKEDPPFLIIQGEKDQSVPNTQSRVFHAWLTLAGVPAKLIIVPDAPHYGVMFDADWIRPQILEFLKAQTK